jgi:hypothetical protein
LNDEDQARKYFHELYLPSKDSLVGFPPTPLKEWQQDKDHHRVERGTTDGEQSSSGVGRTMKSEVNKLRAK